MKPKNRYKFPSAVLIILTDGDKILLQKRQNTGFADGM